LKKSHFKKIILGTEVFSGAWGLSFSEKKVDQIIQKAFENNIKEIDTSPSYGKLLHQVESLIGKSIKNHRSKLIINTKFSNQILGSNNYQSQLRISHLQKSIDLSLKALKTDYIDNLFFHSGADTEFFYDDLWYHLNSLKKKGIVKNLGVAIKHDLVKKNHLSQIKIFKEYQISMVSTVLNMYSQESLKILIPFCKKNKLTVYSRMPLAKGLLSGKYTYGHKFSPEDPRSKNYIFTNKILRFVKKNKKIDANSAIKWAIEHSDKTILSFKNIEQINNLK
jgi:myo-inositol catabolism protein IolS